MLLRMTHIVLLETLAENQPATAELLTFEAGYSGRSSLNNAMNRLHRMGLVSRTKIEPRGRRTAYGHLVGRKRYVYEITDFGRACIEDHYKSLAA